MRIDLVSEHASPLAAVGAVDSGGQNVHVAALALALARRGGRVVVHTRRDDDALPARVAMGPGVVVHHVDAGPACTIPKDDLLPHMDAFAARLRATWSSVPPDVVHAHFWMSGRAAVAAAGPLGVPVVQTFHALGTVKRRHQGAADTSPPQRLAEERAVARRADLVLATCRDEVAELVAMGADRARVRVVPCGVDVRMFTPAGPRAHRSSVRHRVVTVGRMVERKGIDGAIAALALVPDAELVVAGGPPRTELAADPEARRLAALARSLDVDDRVTLLGAVARAGMPPLLRSADAVVCAPRYEPFGMVALEAMACGVPVVASAVGGLLDSVADGVTGVLVPPRDPDALAAALRALLADPARRAAMGRAGRRRALACFGWERIAEATLDAYRSLGAIRRVQAVPA